MTGVGVSSAKAKPMNKATPSEFINCIFSIESDSRLDLEMKATKRKV